ncbi:MAG: hypothetical protein JSS87_00285, partial [Acidobacteria bacterium]|nr:hypothetical protein [Acidobacteriota bacterium]
VIGIAQNEAKVMLKSHIFRAAHSAWKKWIGDIRHDHDDHVGFIFAQRTAKK